MIKILSKVFLSFSLLCPAYTSSVMGGYVQRVITKPYTPSFRTKHSDVIGVGKVLLAGAGAFWGSMATLGNLCSTSSLNVIGSLTAGFAAALLAREHNKRSKLLPGNRPFQS